MITPLQTFLIERKKTLLAQEKIARGRAQDAILGQLQAIDATLMFLTSQQKEDDMTKLRLTLDRQATPADDIKPRQKTEELTEALIDLANELQDQVRKEKKELKFPLNNLPSTIKPKSATSKIYGLKKAGRLPPAIFPTTRTERDENGKTREILYMRCKYER